MSKTNSYGSRGDCKQIPYASKLRIPSTLRLFLNALVNTTVYKNDDQAKEYCFQIIIRNSVSFSLSHFATLGTNGMLNRIGRQH